MIDDWTDLVAALAAQKARFLIVGAHAMAVHGVPRGTHYMDIWVDPTPANADRVWPAVAAFGAPLADLRITSRDLRRAGTVIQLGLPPNRIDFLRSLSGLPEFDAAWAARVEGVRVD